MKQLSRTDAEINQEQQRFLSKPHGAAKLYAAAKTLWEQEGLISQTQVIDRWAFFMNHKTPSKPGKDRPFGSEIIAVLRKHLAQLQGNRCCYCRRWLQNIAYARPIEHILSRKDYPQFSLHYWNLAVSCKDCNQLKLDKKWTTLSSHAKEYPIEALDHFHPRIHIFDGHVRYVRIETNDSSIAIYHGLTVQGRQLCRDHLKTVSQVDGLMHNNPQIASAIAKLQLAGEMLDPAASIKLNEFIDQLHAAVHRIATRVK